MLGEDSMAKKGRLMQVGTFEESSRTYRWLLLGFAAVCLLLAIHWFSVGKNVKAWTDIGLACITLVAYGTALWVGRDG